MKKWIGAILAITFPALVLLAADAKTQKDAPASAPAKNSGHATEKAMDKPSPKTMAGKVTKVNARAKTFEMDVHGKSVTVSGAKLKGLPKVGDAIEVTYNESSGGGPVEATNFNLSRSNSY
ncbi:MAG: hypothetical protein ACRD16_04860 [Thermoanaerobaculia bacterium]